MLVGSAMTLAVPQGLRMVIDAATGVGTVSLQLAVWMMVFAVITQAVATALRFSLMSVAGIRVITDLRQRVFEHVLSLKIELFDARPTGEIVSRLATDIAVVQSTITTNLAGGVRHVLFVAGGVALLLYTSLPLTILMLLVVPLVVLGAFLFGRVIRAIARDVMDASARASDVVQESVGSIRTVKSFVAEDQQASRYGAANLEMARLSERRSVANGIYKGTMSLATYASIGLVLWYGAQLLGDGALTVGALASFAVYTALVASSILGMAQLWVDIMQVHGSAQRVFELLDQQPEEQPQSAPRRRRVRSDGAGVCFESVSFAYPSRPDATVLHDIDFQIRRDEVVALVGPSGSGKTTIASLLLRLYDATRGRILLDGEDIRDLEPKQLRRRIAIVEQEPVLFSTTIADNIRCGNQGVTAKDLERACHAAHIADLVERLPEGLETHVGERGLALSGGQKQRVAIARAMLRDPTVLVLDEATSSLDAESEHLVRAGLETLMKGRATLIIAHRLSTVMHADRIIVLEHGRVAESGSHRELVANSGLYRRLVERQLSADALELGAGGTSPLLAVPGSA